MPLGPDNLAWWCSSHLQIAHPSLDIDLVTSRLQVVPKVAKRPGESKIRIGECISAGYWSSEHRYEYPARPDTAIQVVEDLVGKHLEYLSEIISNGGEVAVYVGIHVSVLALGFNLPKTPSIDRAGIVIGLEYFGS